MRCFAHLLINVVLLNLGFYVVYNLMEQKFNFDEIKVRYKYYYQWAVHNKKQWLPYYEIQAWDHVLNAVELRTFEDIREFGLPLWPIFPISETDYFHFANPFRKVAIEIKQKDTPPGYVDRKMKLYSAAGWKIYTLNSNTPYLSIDDFFNSKQKDNSRELSSLDDATVFEFVKKYHTENAACLLYYLQYLHFSDREAYAL